MARRIRWQILIAVISASLVLGLMGYLALTTAAVARPIAGGVYTEFESAQPAQLNPLVSNPARDPVAADLQALLFDGLMRTGIDGRPEPALVQRWPEIDDSGTVYTFTLRADVTWHDGQPLTSDDVLFTLHAIQSPAFVGDPTTARLWNNVLLARIDARSFRATLPAPRGSFLSYAIFPILPAHLLANTSPDTWGTISYDQQPIGTGPYRLSAPISSERALLQANPAYFRGRPYLDSIEIRFNQNSQDALAAIARNQAVGFGLPSTNDQTRATPPRGATRHTIPLSAYSALTFNLRQAPMNDQGLRRALALGTDKAALIQAVFAGQAQALETPLLPGWWPADSALDQPHFNQASATDTLTSLGYTLGADGVRSRDGKPLVLALLTDDAPDHTAATRELVRQWAMLGIQTSVEQVTTAVFEQRLQAHQFSIALQGWQRQGADPDILYTLWHSSGAETGYNYAGLQDAEIDAQLTLGRENSDDVTRQAAYAAFQRRWLDLAPGITLYQPLYIYTASSDLGGLALDSQQEATTATRPLLLNREDRFYNITNWFLRSGREIKGDLRQAP